MDVAVTDTCVEEYHFWHGMLALSTAIGRDAYLVDNPNVYGNLYICMLGGSGSGKSKSKRHMDHVIREAMPVGHSTSMASNGAPATSAGKILKEVTTPGSGEFLIEQFSERILAPAGGSKAVTVIGYEPVRGIISFSELSVYKALAGRQGSSLGSLMLDFYDCKDRISSGSRGGGTLVAEYPYASALTTTQPRSLAKLLTHADEDSGFLNRWLFVGGKVKPARFIEPGKPSFHRSSKLLEHIHHWASGGREITFDPKVVTKAQQDLNDFVQPDMIQNDPAMNRMDLTIKKLCLLLAANEKKMVIDLDIYERVISMYEYIKAFALYRTGAIIVKTLEAETEDIIIEKIQEFYNENRSWPSAREIRRKVSESRMPGGTGAIIKTLANFEEIGLVEKLAIKPEGRGRPTIKYKLAEGVTAEDRPS